MLHIETRHAVAETGYFRLDGTLRQPDEAEAVRAVWAGAVLAVCPLRPADAGQCTSWRLEAFGGLPPDGILDLEVIGRDRVLESARVTVPPDAGIARAIARLRQDYDVRVFGPQDRTHTDNETALKRLRQGPVPVIEERLEPADLAAWIVAAGYAERYPNYVREFPPGGLLEAKAAQHLISARLCGLEPGMRLLDTASSASPFWRIARDRFGLDQSLRQDWNFPAGRHEDTIGSDAGAIPLPDASQDAITSHCSFEHFEGDTDVRALGECARLLAPGGSYVIVPLYFANCYAVLTSPHIWHDKYRAISEPPAFAPGVTVYLREDIRQRQAKFFTAEALIDRILLPFADAFAFSIHYYANYAAVPGCPAFALRGIRRGRPENASARKRNPVR